MTRPKVRRHQNGVAGCWGRRLGFNLVWNDPPCWRWPRIELHRDGGATGVLIGWRMTALALVVLDPVTP